MKNLPNLITLSRIAAALVLIPVRAFSGIFFGIYTYCGISDVLDGALSRKMNLESESGARLDSAADLVFYAVMLVKILPDLAKILPLWARYAVGLILLLRILSYITAALKYRRFASMHTYMNKLTGFLVFTIPYIMLVPFAKTAFIIIICTAALLSSAEEMLIHILSKEYDPDRKTLLRYRRTGEIDSL